MPDFKGLFSDPEFYQLNDDERTQAYQQLAASAPDMQDLSPEQHNQFFREMVRLNAPQQQQMRLSGGEIERITGQPTDVEPMVVRDERLLAPQIPEGVGAPEEQLPQTDIGRGMLKGAEQVAQSAYDTNALLGALGVAPRTAGAEAGRVAQGVSQMAGQVPDPEGLLGQIAQHGSLTAMMMLATAPAMAAGGVGGISAAGAGSGGLEALMEAGGVFNQLKQQGMSEEEALSKAGDDFVKQAMLLIGTEAAQAGILGKLGKDGVKIAKEIIERAGSKVGRRAVLETGKALAGGAGVWELNRQFEGAQEWLQEGINQSVMETAGMFDNTEQQKEAYKVGKLIGGVFGFVPAAAGAAIGVAEAPGAAIQGAKTVRAAEQIGKIRDIIANPEEAAREGKIELTRPQGPDPKEARFRATETLDYLTTEERQTFALGEQPLDVEEIARRTERPVEEVKGEIDTLDQAAQDLISPPRQPAQPAPEHEAVLRAISDGIEKTAQEAEAIGQPELAADRRARIGKVQIVEPQNLFERGAVGVAKIGRSDRRVVLFTQPRIEGEPVHGGVFVKPGLIAIDVSDGIAPRAIIGTIFHEVVHDAKVSNPELYAGVMEAIKGTPLWQKSEDTLLGEVNDDEIFAHVMEQSHVATDVLYALANYAAVEDMAKAPSRVRAVIEYLTGLFRAVAGKLRLTSDLDGKNLKQMKRISALFADPETKRNAAKAILELTDMLKAAPQEAQGEVTEGPQFSRTFSQLRQDEGITPRGLDSISTETKRFFEVKESLFKDLRKAGVPSDEAYERAAEGADTWVRKNMKILDEEDLDDEQKMLVDYAQGLGVQVNFYEGGHKMAGGHFMTEGQIWINNGTKTLWTFRQLVAHEMMHDFKRRHPALWRKILNKAIELMPEEWKATREEVLKLDSYKMLTGDKLDNEVLAFLIHNNANDFWGAVLKAGSEENAPVAFRRFFTWVGEFVKKLSGPMFEWAKSVGIIGIATDMTSPSEQLGRFVVEQFTRGTVKDGEYQVYNPQAHEKRVAEKKATMKKAITQQLSRHAPLAKRFAADLERGIVPEQPEQIPLFSTERVGYPPLAQTPAELRTWRAKLAKMVWRGVKGKMWYELSAAAILQMSGGNLETARKFTRLVAVYSPQTGVMTNWHRALTAWQRYMAGYSKSDFLKERLGNDDNHQKAAAILYDDAAWDGEKTNSFFSNLFTLLDSEVPDRATIDLWMMRAMGFSGDAPSPTQYRAMEKEVKRLAKKLDVETHQAQAMIWVYAKSVWESKEVKEAAYAEAAKRDMTTHVPKVANGKIVKDKRGKVMMTSTPEFEALYRGTFNAAVKRDLGADVTLYPISEQSMTTFATGLERRVATISMEAIPGVGWFKNLSSADISTKVWFTLGVEQALVDEVGDIIGQEMGISPVADINMMLLGNSAYYDGGRIQVNPSRQIKVPAAAKGGAESSYMWDAASKDQVTLYAVIRGMLTGQESVAGYRRFDQNPVVEERNMAELRIGNRLSYDQQTELVEKLTNVVKSRSGKLQGWEVALYPTEDGVAFMNTTAANMTNLEFHDVVKETISELSFKKGAKMSTWAADTFYVEAENDTGEVDTYGQIIAGRTDILRRVEDRVADKLSKHYLAAQDRGLGDAPEWAVAYRDTETTLRRDAKSYTHYWHFSVADVTDEGIKRDFAGTGATGQEGQRFRFDPNTGKLDPESAVIHLYLPTARAEAAVVSKASFINKVIADLRLIPTDSAGLGDLYRKHNGDAVAVATELRSMGYDGIVDVDRGMVQVNRDIDVSELGEGHELTPKERRAWKGALRLEDMEEGESYDHIRVPRVQELKRADVEHVASRLTDDGVAYFPKGTNERMVKQYFDEVRSTSVGLVATKPRRPQFSTSIVDQHQVPVGDMNVVDDEVAYGTRYATQSGPGWSLPGMDRWDWFVKWAQDSLVQFKRLNDVFTDHGIEIGEEINVRLAEELYHGKVQEATKRIDEKYQQPLLRALRALSKSRAETEADLLAKFDLYLHARHASERNAHIREVWHTRKLEQAQFHKNKIQDKLAIYKDELKDAEGKLHKKRLENAIKFWEMRLVSAERTIETIVNQKDLDSGMSNAEAIGVFQSTRIDGLDKRFSELARQYVDTMLKERLDALYSEGLVDEKTYKAVAKYKHYVPLKGKFIEGDLEEMIEMYHASSSGFDIRGAELPFVTGREKGSKINPILAQAFVDTLSATDRIERNRVAVALLGLAEEHPNQNLWEVNKTVKKRIFDKKTGTVKEVEDWFARNEANVIAAKRDGQTYYVTLKDRGLAEAMKGLGIENLWKWVRGVRVVMRTLAQLYTTWNPDFILTNFARDWQQAIVSSTTDMGSKAAVEVSKEAFKAVRGILAANFPDALGKLTNEYTAEYHELKEAGGKVGFFGMRGIDDMQRAIINDMKSGHQAATMRGLRRIGNYIGSINEATENGIRLATYVVAKRHGATRAQAASLAKNVSVNFNRRGDVGGAIGAGYLFFNAGVQGVDRFWKSMKTPSGQKLAAMYLGIGFMTAVWSRATMGDDDDGEPRYDKISNFTKMRNWIIGIPGTDGEFVQIPMPYGFGVWGQLGKELEHLIFSGDDRLEAAGEAALRMLSGLTTHFSPIGETSFENGWYAMARPIIPTLAEPWTDVLANETYWGGKIYPAKAPWDNRSDSARHYPGRTVTERLMIGATSKLNYWTGGSEYRSGIIDLNPNALTYILDSYIGPTGGSLKRPINLIQKKWAGDDTTWNDWIILRRFLGETAPQYYVPGEFYDAVEDVTSAADELEWYKKGNGSRDDYRRWSDRHGWKVGLDKSSRQAQKALREIRKSSSLSDQEKRDRSLAIQRGFIKRYLNSEKR